MKDGDLCIKGKPSEFLGQPVDAFIDDLMAQILSGDKKTNRLIYCLDCTEHGGPFGIEVYHTGERNRG
jgi:ABC-type proline/glycine betaine transport system ATPase subunit